MGDQAAQERRRLSAAWLNIVAAGLASAGVLQALAGVAAEGWGERAERLLILGAGCGLAGFGVHLLARPLIPSAWAKRRSGVEPLSEQNVNTER